MFNNGTNKSKTGIHTYIMQHTKLSELRKQYQVQAIVLAKTENKIGVRIIKCNSYNKFRYI